MLAPKVTVDLSRYRPLVRQTVAVMGGLCEVAADVGVRAAIAHARAKPRFRSRTGRLLRDIRITQQARFNGRFAFSEAQAVTGYALFVEEGTRAHWIRPRLAYAHIGPANRGQTRAGWDKVPGRLTFYSERLGRWISVLEVWHPGTKATNFMSRGAHAAVPRMATTWAVLSRRVVNLWR